MKNIENRPLCVERSITPMTYDIDIEDHVNNIVYIKWLEDLRYWWLAEYFPLEPMIKRDLAPAITETHIYYKTPIHLFENVTGRIWVGEMRGVRFRLMFEFLVNDQVAATAEQVGAWIKVSSGRPVRNPESLRKLWEEQS